MVSRRRLLLGSALGGSVALAARTAAAFSTEEIAPQSGLGLALSNRCGGPGEHAQLIAGAQRELAARGARLGATEVVTCPVCGCPVTVTAR